VGCATGDRLSQVTVVAVSVPSPREFLPSCPDAIVDLQTHEGVALVSGEWRYSDTKVREIDFVAVGPDLGPSGPPNRSYEVVPHAQSADFPLCQDQVRHQGQPLLVELEG